MKEFMILVIERAMTGAEALTPAERADLLDGVAALTTSRLPEISARATAAAEALREAEARQMTFTALLRAAAVCEPQPQHDTTTP